MTSGSYSKRTLVFTRADEDGCDPRVLLENAGLPCTHCHDLECAVSELNDGAGIAIFDEEALAAFDVAPLVGWLADQPAWSDMHSIVLTRRRPDDADATPVGRFADLLGNAIVIERPFHPAVLVAAVRAALRSRDRQYEARARIEELYAREEQLRVAQQAGGVGTFEIFPDRGEVVVSDAFRKLWGLPDRGTLKVSEMIAMVDRRDRPEVRTAEPELAEDSLDYVEYRIHRLDNGAERWMARRGEHVRDPATGTVRHIGVSYDITERKQIEERLRESEAALRHLNETLEEQVARRTLERDRIWSVSRDLLGVSDMDARWLSINPAWQTLLGWEPEEIVGRTTAWLRHPDDIGRADEQLARIRAGDPTQGFQSRMRTADGGYRWISWTTTTVGDRVFSVGRDVTEALQRLEELARAQDALRQAQKMEAVGQLTGGIAHDFNNLLTGILGGLDIVKRRIATGRLDDVDRFIDAGITSANRAAALVHRLLAFSRRQSLDQKPVDCNLLIGSLRDLLERTVGEAIVLDFNLEPSPWLAETDANQLENALLNLVINARDAMPEGGRLTVTTRNQRLDAAAAAGLGDLEPGDCVLVSVGDSGTGMTPDVLERAFDPFFTTKEIGAGTGLGLSMIYGFIKQSNGHIGIDSAPGAGSTITLYLRRSAVESVGEDAPENAAARRLSPPVAVDGETVLVVEDDAGVRQLVVALLDERGYAHVELDRADPAIPLLASGRRVDLLITDVGLPGMNGRQLAEVARRHRPDLPILFITGYAEQASERNAFLGDGMAMITKPFDLDTLSAKIDELIAT